MDDPRETWRAWEEAIRAMEPEAGFRAADDLQAAVTSWQALSADLTAEQVTRVAVVRSLSIRKLAQHLGISRSRANQELQRAKRKGEP